MWKGVTEEHKKVRQKGHSVGSYVMIINYINLVRVLPFLERQDF